MNAKQKIETQTLSLLRFISDMGTEGVKKERIPKQAKGNNFAIATVRRSLNGLIERGEVSLVGDIVVCTKEGNQSLAEFDDIDLSNVGVSDIKKLLYFFMQDNKGKPFSKQSIRLKSIARMQSNKTRFDLSIFTAFDDLEKSGKIIMSKINKRGNGFVLADSIIGRDIVKHGGIEGYKAVLIACSLSKIDRVFL